MTPEYIMRKSLCRLPSCYRAHVVGKGYVNDGKDESTRADYLRQWHRDAQSAIDNLGYAKGYSEPGYSDPEKGVLFCNWNLFCRDLTKILERYGYEIEWEDEWATCGECGNAVRTSPDGWDWRPYYDSGALQHGELICLDCVKQEDNSTREV